MSIVHVPVLILQGVITGVEQRGERETEDPRQATSASKPVAAKGPVHVGIDGHAGHEGVQGPAPLKA